MNWPVVGWPAQNQVEPIGFPQRSAQSDNIIAGYGWPGEPQPNTGRRWRLAIPRPSLTFASKNAIWIKELRRFVSANSNVATSPDGLKWTLHGSLSSNSIAWSPSLRVAVSVASNRVDTSANCQDWTSGVAAAANSWTCVEWSPELSIFCAVAASGTGNRVMTSPDGITWTARTSAADNSWQSLVWAAGLSLFVAVSITGTNRVMTSPDGITWTAQTCPSQSWYAVVWSQPLNTLVAIGSSGRAMYSRDGVNWTQSPGTPLSGTGYQAIWAEKINMFIAVMYGNGTGSSSVFVSYDGVNWSGTAFIGNRFWYAVAWSPELNRLVVGGTNESRLLVSP